MQGQKNIDSVDEIMVKTGNRMRNLPACLAGSCNKRIFDDTNAGITSISLKSGVEFAAAVVKRVANRRRVFDLRDYWATIFSDANTALMNETIIGAKSFRRKAA